MRLSMMCRIMHIAEEHRLSLPPWVSRCARGTPNTTAGRKGVSFLYMTSWCLLSNLCMTIFHHEHKPSPIKTVDSLFFSRSKITNVLLENANRKVMIKRIIRFLFVEKEKLSARKIDFNVFDQVFFTAS